MADIIALMIPIVAIISFSSIGKAIAQAIIVNSGASSINNNNKIAELEKRINEQETELTKLREIVIFNDKKSIQVSDNSKNELNRINQSINLEKNL